MANPFETAAVRLVTVCGTVAVLRSVAASLRSSSEGGTDELAALLIKETCTAAATGLFVLGNRGALSPESTSGGCLAPTDDRSPMSTADYALLLRCLVDVYEILIPAIASTMARERSGGRGDFPWATTCACCLDAAHAIVDSFALQPLVTGASPTAPLAFLSELIRYEAGAELPLSPAMSCGSAASSLRPHARGALVADLFALGGVLQRLEAIAAPALSSESSPAAFVTALLRRHNTAALASAPSPSLRAPVATAGAAATGSSGGGGSAFEGGALAALLDILPGVDAAAAGAALRACGGDVAAAVERLVSSAESDIIGGGGGVTAAAGEGEAAAPLALSPVRTRRGDQVLAVDAALKAATLRRVDDMDARAAAAAAARLLDGRADTDGRGGGGVGASAAALAVFGPLGDAYADEYDDTYDDAALLDVPGGEGSSAGGSSDGGDGPARAGRQFRGGPPVSRGGAGAGRGARGSSGRGRGGASASHDNPTARSAPTAGADVEGGDASGGDAGDGARHSRRGRGGGAARGSGRGGGESEVTGHGPRARGGVTERDAARRRELKARLGNHNRKRGADRKLFGRGGGSAGGAPGGGAAL